jgi:hypothetical protein
MIEDGEVRTEGHVCEVGAGYTTLSETRRQQSRSSPRGTYDEA